MKDKKNGIVNIASAIFSKVIILVLALLTKRLLISQIGNDANGVYSLFTSIIGVLSIAELGVGTAVCYSMYKPIVNEENNIVAGLYHLITKIYFIVGLVILAAGCGTLPLLPFLAKDYSASSLNLYLSFFLLLVSVFLSYFFSSKVSLINAYKKNYVTTLILSITTIIQYGLQMLILFLTKSFELYITCQIIAILIQWVIVEVYTRKNYQFIISLKGEVPNEIKREVKKNTYALFLHKIGWILVNSIDSILISYFLGVVVLGKYSNYLLIVSSMFSVLILFFTPLTSIVGQLAVSKKDELPKYYVFFHLLNFVIGIIFYLGYYASVNYFIQIVFGGNLLIDSIVVKILTINYFVQFMRQSALLFKDATGTFYPDRWKPFIEGIVNLLLSLLLAYLLPDQYKIVGILGATIFTNLFVSHVVEPYVLYRNVFNQKPTHYYVKNYLLIALFSGLIFSYDFIIIPFDNVWLGFLVNGSIAVVVAVAISLPLCLLTKEFKQYIKLFLRRREAKKNE